jgi:hypothetical protein
LWGSRVLVKNHLADRHLADRQLADRHLANRHLADRHLANRHLADRHLDDLPDEVEKMIFSEILKLRKNIGSNYIKLVPEL